MSGQVELLKQTLLPQLDNLVDTIHDKRRRRSSINPGLLPLPAEE